MFICGNDEAAKRTVTGILGQFGWETADMGKAEAARAIEPLCMLWCIPGFLSQTLDARLQAPSRRLTPCCASTGKRSERAPPQRVR